MDYGIKFSKPGQDVLKGLSTEPTSESRSGSQAHVQLGLMSSYYWGASMQIKRYRNAASKLEQDGEAHWIVLICLHEISCLMESLDTVARYCELCGESHLLHELWRNARNHIRHDVREELDNDSRSGKRTRLAYFQMADHLQTSIGFDKDAFCIGKKTIELSEIEGYLQWVKETFRKHTGEAADALLVVKGL